MKIRKATADDGKILAIAVYSFLQCRDELGVYPSLYRSKDEAVSAIMQTFAQDSDAILRYRNFYLACEGAAVLGVCASTSSQHFMQYLTAFDSSADETLHERFAALELAIPAFDRQALVIAFLYQMDDDDATAKALIKKVLLDARLHGFRMAEVLLPIQRPKEELLFASLGFKANAVQHSPLLKESFGCEGLQLLHSEL